MEEKPFFEKRIDFDDYSVVLSNCFLKYIFKGESGEERTCHIPTGAITCSFEDGITKISYTDRFSSKMYFEHCPPSHLKGFLTLLQKAMTWAKF